MRTLQEYTQNKQNGIVELGSSKACLNHKLFYPSDVGCWLCRQETLRRIAFRVRRCPYCNKKLRGMIILSGR